MTFADLRTVAPRFLPPLLAGLLIFAAGLPAARAADKNTFVINETEGYGITDCLKGAKSCGRVVADAWCEAHGLGAATAYGAAEDVTASTHNSSGPKDATRPGSVIVTCAN